jgi:hypothetical protein
MILSRTKGKMLDAVKWLMCIVHGHKEGYTRQKGHYCLRCGDDLTDQWQEAVRELQEFHLALIKARDEYRKGIDRRTDAIL